MKESIELFRKTKTFRKRDRRPDLYTTTPNGVSLRDHPSPETRAVPYRSDSRSLPWRSVLPSLFVMAAGTWLPTQARGQQAAQGRPTSEEIARSAEEAEHAPLFASHDPVAVTLRADIENLKNERDENIEREGTLTFPGPDRQPRTVPVKLTTRGIFRLDKRNCSFPPLRLDLPKSRVDGTVFHGQNRLKLVAPCNERRDDDQRSVLLEYLVYRTYNVLTPVSFRVRLLHITFTDSSGKHEDRAKYAFLIEDVDRLAERNFAEESEWEQFHPYAMQDHQAVLVDLFQFMIGNTDWSAPYFHNIKMISTDGPTYLVIPFDFDFSGAVEARYATPDPTLDIRRVRDRLYRGFCRDDLDFAPLFALFNERRESIYEMVRGFEPLEERRRNRLLDYYDEFYEIINDDGRTRREIHRRCRRPTAPGQ